MIRVAVAVALVCAAPQLARAEPAAEVPASRRALGVGAALVPGAILHGSGHWVVGEHRTARRLLVLEGVGIGLFALGAVPLGVSGAARDVSGPAVTAMVAGGTMFLAGILIDAYGASGLAARAGRAPAARPQLELEAGYAYVDDPQFDYGSFAVLQADLRLGPTRVTPVAWLALDDDNQRLMLDAAYRALDGRDDSWVEAVFGVTHHRAGGDDFAVTGVEASASGRIELARLGPSVRGAFAELLLGVGIERIGYRGVADDWNSQLLGRAALGLYLGDGRGEASIYYDHRRDDYAGGLALARGGGFIGHFGAAARYRVRGPWRAVAMLERGAANVVRLGVSCAFDLGVTW